MRDPYICYRTTCRYHTGKIGGDSPSCDYFFITGRTKTSQGEADRTKKCGLYEPGKNVRRVVKPVVTPAKNRMQKEKREARAEDLRRRHEGKAPTGTFFHSLWKEGKTDDAIAKEIGCCRETVVNWRRWAGLTANAHRPVIDREQLRKLYSRGLNDSEIAKATGASRQAVWTLRQKMGLPPQNPQRSNRRAR